MEMKSRYCTYIRVSTKKQNASGLGEDAQRAICATYIGSQDGEFVKEFSDVESGKSTTRKGLWEAIDFCKDNCCTLVVAKLDRLARDVELCFKVVNTGIEIHFCDMPVVNSFVLGVFASLAQYERELISSRTKAALDARKERGELPGGSRGLWGTKTGADKRREEIMERTRERSSAVRRERAIANASNTFFANYVHAKYGKDAGKDDIDFDSLADELNMLGQKTPTGLGYTRLRAMATYNKLSKMKTI